MEIHDLNDRRHLEFETKVRPNKFGLPDYNGNVPIHEKKIWASDQVAVMINVKEARIMNDQSVQTGQIYILDEENPYNIDLNDIDAYEKGINRGAKLSQDYKAGVKEAIKAARQKVADEKAAKLQAEKEAAKTKTK